MVVFCTISLQEQLFRLFNAPTRNSHAEDVDALGFDSHEQYTKHQAIQSSNLNNHEHVHCVRKLNWKRLPDQIKMLSNYAKYDPPNFCGDLKVARYSFFRVNTSQV